MTWEFFGSDVAKDAVRKKVTALFPEHEIEQFTEYFWQRVQLWRQQEAQYSSGPGGAPAS